MKIEGNAEKTVFFSFLYNDAPAVLQSNLNRTSPKNESRVTPMQVFFFFEKKARNRVKAENPSFRFHGPQKKNIYQICDLFKRGMRGGPLRAYHGQPALTITTE
jgi:hypothetical protein